MKHKINKIKKHLGLQSPALAPAASCKANRQENPMQPAMGRVPAAGGPGGAGPMTAPHWALSPLAEDEACSRGAAVSGWALLLECPLGCWAAGGEIKQTPGCFILCRGLAPGAGKRKGGLKTAAFFCCLVGSFFPLRTSGPLLACVLWAEQTLWPWTCNAQRTLSR